jgi:hypothetical protein
MRSSNLRVLRDLSHEPIFGLIVPLIHVLGFIYNDGIWEHLGEVAASNGEMSITPA